MSGLEGLAGTPMRVESPVTGGAPPVANNLEDLMGIFGNDSAVPVASPPPGANGKGAAANDLMNGLAGLDISGSGASSSTPQAQKKSNTELMDLF
jgi:hypothetical protein